MSAGGTIEVVNASRSQLQGNYDYQKIFIGGNEYITGSYTNGTGAVVELMAGMLFGRIAATNKVEILKSAATDGSQFPLGILGETLSVADAATVTVTIAISGDINLRTLILDGTDTLATVISDRTIEDRIAADTKGIRLVATVENTAFDNQ